MARFFETSLRLCAGLFAALALFAFPAAAVELHGAGATFPAPLYKDWIEQFGKNHPGAKLSYESVGSGEGLARFDAGSVDFAGSDVPMPSTDDERASSIGAQFPVTAGMVALAYRLPGVAGPLNLPRDVYADIFLGRIRRWNDPKIAAANPRLKLPALDITVVARLDSSGTTFAFTTHVASISPSWDESGVGVGKKVAWPAGFLLADGNNGVAERIKEHEGAIGYVEYGVARRAGLPVAELENRAGRYVAPSPESGAAAFNHTAYLGLDHLKTSILDPTSERAYPIVSYSWLILRWEYPSAKLEVMRDFVDFVLGEGQKRALELGYVPLPGSVAYRGKAVLARVFSSDDAETEVADIGDVHKEPRAQRPPVKGVPLVASGITD